MSRREGGKIFGSGSRAGISLTFLVKKKNAKGECHIRYHDIGDYLDRKQKLDAIRGFGSIGNMADCWRSIKPNKHHDWINQRSEAFQNYLPLGEKDNKRNKGTVPSVFTLYSLGVATSRDVWAFNFSKATLTENMEKTIAFYNSEVERYKRICKEINDTKKHDIRSFVNYDSTKIGWGNLLDYVAKKESAQFIQENRRVSIYRPFCKQWLYFDQQLNARRYQQPKIFPKPDTQNLAICVSGTGASKEFSALMVDTLPDLEVVSKSQCFPRYRYITEEATGRQTSLEIGEVKHTQVDNIPEETVSRFRNHYRDNTIDGDAVFYYAYGLLHSPDYKTRFSADLKKMLPRIPLVGSLKDFQAFSEAGRELAALHVGYEEAEGWPLTIKEEQSDLDEDERFRVKKMGFGSTAKARDKTTIRYNKHVTVEGIPPDAYEYVVNGKSAIEWVMERYQTTQHKDSKIVNDPNTWSDDPRYILELLQKVVTVSMKTVEIVSGLPELDVT